MKYIKKGEEPESLTAWKALANDDWTPTYDDLRGREKTDVYNALLQEQGFICCYCGIGITRETCHIEHLKPQSTHPHLELEYSNMLASCQGESEAPPPKPVHCGHKKDEWYDENMMVSPMEANCADSFKYTGSGEIQPTDAPDKQAAARETIRRLGLNINKLQRMRRKAIDKILLGIADCTNEEIQQLAVGYARPDAVGQYTAFCGAIVYILKHYFVP